MSQRGPQRQASIDVLRAAAIVVMVFVHFRENLSGEYAGDTGPLAGISRFGWLPTGFAAPTFAFLSGLSYRLWLEAWRRRGRSEASISKGTVRRGLFLIGFGFAFNILVWLPEDVFNWDILTLIGCGMLALEAARRMPDAVVVFAASLTIAVAPAMREAAGYAEYWSLGFFDHDFTMSDVILGWLVTGYFPIFPWLAFPLLGYALAPKLLADGVGQHRIVLIALGLVAMSSVMVIGWPMLSGPIAGGSTEAWTMFPATTVYVFGTLGGTCLGLVAMHHLLDGDKPRGRWLVAWATPLSRHSLSLYLLHHVVHIWPLWGWSLAATGETTALWQTAMPAWAAVTLATLFTLVASPICRWVEKHDIPTAESLLRWLSD